MVGGDDKTVGRLPTRRVLLTSTVAITVSALAVSWAAAQMVPVGGKIQVSTSCQTTDSRPDVDMAPDGSFVVVWTNSANDGSGCPGSMDATPPGSESLDVYVQRFDPQGDKIGTEFIANTITAYQESDPAVAVDPGNTGRFAVVWSGADSNYGGIRGNLFVPDPSNTDSVVTVENEEELLNATAAGNQANAEVSFLPPLGFVVVWEQQFPNPAASVRTFSFDYPGDILFGTELTLADPLGASGPVIDSQTSGAFVVAWASTSVGTYNQDIVGQRFDNMGALSGTRFPINSNTAFEQNSPKVGMRDSNGDFVVSWEKGTSNYNQPALRKFDWLAGEVFSERGASELPPPAVPPNAPPKNADVAVADDGSFATVFETFIIGQGPRVDGLLFDAAGNIVDSSPPMTNMTDKFEVHSVPADGSAARNPKIATNGTGRYVVVYDDTDYLVAARLFDATMPTAICGDADSNGTINATDALIALFTGVGSGDCPACVCDVNSSGPINTTDALNILFEAVGIIVELICPPCT